ncbi:Glycine receptor subunit alpha-3 [Portunus trituberculatus]|uniref:Glycine receptor subunit alpha-3 n=1 Tax=Portunus trituberculatus TaxID=210409 RepID=A0A5B7GXY0_PORTR|nr:Glycine receptor subunit alpha-3 [Portunus trituberculatus]
MLSAATDFVKLDRNASEVMYVGAELLIEYTSNDEEEGRRNTVLLGLVCNPQVVSVSLTVNNSYTMAQAEVKVVLQRRVGYPIISIYVPTVILLILAYLSLVFRRDNFDTRVMSSLTVLLVLASLFTQASLETSTSLPKTSYFKMVDVWLLFCISLIFFVIVFHVTIDMAATGQLTGDSSKFSTTTQVFPFKGKEKMFSPPQAPEPRRMMLGKLLPTGGNSPEEKKRLLSEKLFRQALIFIPGYFILFNIIYWIYIFA